ncbi:MAG: hypothetical protein ACJ8ER_01925 [Allosphingosinicella sp.]
MKRHRAITAAAAAAALFVGAPGRAQVPVCDGLSLYANGVDSRLCKSLSPTTQNLWVCALTDGATDVHATFNAGTALHITVRINPGAPACQGHSNLAGSYPVIGLPITLQLAPGQPQVICGVNVGNYVQRLAAVPRMAPNHGQNRVQTPMLDAMHAGRVTQALGQTYINTANAQHC